MLKGEPINELLQLGAIHALYYKEGTWYHELNDFPGILIDPNGYIVFETRADYLNYPGIDFGPAENQVHIRPNGISSLPTYTSFSDAQKTILKKHNLISTINTPIKERHEPTNEETLKQKREIEIYIRNKKLVEEIKKLYRNTCQICGTQLKIRTKGPKYYSEVHHIKGLGSPHFGPDVKSNLLCVCPDHHTRLDFFTMPISIEHLKLNKHAIDQAYIDYHNKQVKIYNP
ncbi:hypothetical protein F0P96_00020 [Hymenobacter busanensis]|uniref:Uncharacterized protein n=1 Tax=Hymenobacter busanensis TaxID=2607656 RepID=A0A7L4ZWD6_9BACT|nr:HNH endonuclease [Hymenobacter busanensis]KAA9339061.1 hypothetical protein F0P96_00020 [Hymenobacter busanensis]QHJ07176.1 hypothetical protein GUY19_07725 [Hymenobacter busanensis]